jgi:3-dehydroquinate synthase
LKKSQIIYRAGLPKIQNANCLLIYDKVLERSHGPWIRGFPHRHAVRSGEALKDIAHFPSQISKILGRTHAIPRAKLQIVAFGGGSIGDFAGFVASILKRGVGFIQVPSTWLAAMDSAHGGKTALNVDKFKNQIGTFYPADAVYLVKSVLLAQPRSLILQGAGEYYKTLLLRAGPAFNQAPDFQDLTPKQLWRDLPVIIKTKWSIVAKDPFERQKIRVILNLGHTVGHVFEGALGLPHGQAVHLGLMFALRWSHHRKIWTQSWPAGKWPDESLLLAALSGVDKKGGPQSWLKHDKKLDAQDKIQFIFLKKPGYPVVESIEIKELAVEWNRQKSLVNSILKAKSHHPKA